MAHEMQKLKIGSENIRAVPAMPDLASLNLLKASAKTDAQKKAIENIIDSQLAYWTGASEFLMTDNGKDLVRQHGGISIELLNQVAAELKEQGIKNERDDRYRQAAQDATALALAPSGLSTHAKVIGKTTVKST